MYELIVRLFDICRFKKGPEDLPYSLTMLKILAAAFAAVRVLMHYRGDNVLGAVFEAAAEVGYIGLFSGVMLRANRHLNRYYQVAGAFFGCFALIGFIAWPAAAMLVTGQSGGLAFMLLLGFIVWLCAVTAHIVYHALAPDVLVSLGWALAFLVGFVLLSMSSGHVDGIG
ncbi:hypothetical protein [Candidatus Methylomicrobium oryzae]|jgi:hypothetical protein|uniref:hypothetical protein n=1 Tax=Candidatus Methylomicrobium oryzae TaxID=2802053 RepID=UPI0019250131|nr:hypothetical protein [Methylomicrobium sp. RS1]MBL1262707.1 hypothetical protein [Methylomicrobium sp. RS1]